MKLKKGDKLIVTKGKDKGRTGKIEKIFPKTNKVLMPGINIYKRHTKARSEKIPGGIIDIIKPLPVSNVALICPKCNKATRVGYDLSRDGKKTRICRRCKTVI
jgi:large subunit ribosomal protein L24